MEAYVITQLRNMIGKQSFKDFKLDTSACEALWHILLNKFEGRGVKEATKYVSVTSNLSVIIRKIQEQRVEPARWAMNAPPLRKFG